MKNVIIVGGRDKRSGQHSLSTVLNKTEASLIMKSEMRLYKALKVGKYVKASHSEKGLPEFGSLITRVPTHV
jgi:hypothetical protein